MNRKQKRALEKAMKSKKKGALLAAEAKLGVKVQVKVVRGGQEVEVYGAVHN